MKINARSDAPQERGERVHRQVAGMGGGLRQVSDFLDQLFPADLSRFVHILAFDQLGDGRAAGHRRNAALGAKANVGNARFQFRFVWTFFQSKAELQNVSANWVFQSRRGIGRCQFTGVSWVLEMVEKFGGVHMPIVMRSPHYQQVVIRIRAHLPGVPQTLQDKSAFGRWFSSPMARRSAISHSRRRSLQWDDA